MLNAYYFSDDNVSDCFEEEGLTLTAAESSRVGKLAEYIREQYNLPFREFLVEAELDCTTIKPLLKNDDMDYREYADIHLEEFYFKHQRAYTAVLAATKKRKEL
jgi:hypothetical protein